MLTIREITTKAVHVAYKGQHYIMLYRDFPQFKDQPTRSVLNFTESSPGHYCWPDLDVDLTIGMIKRETD